MTKSLPVGWEYSELDNFVEIILGQSPPSSTYNETGNGLPFFQGKLEFGELHPAVQKWCSHPNKIANAGDVLLSIRAPVGATNIAVEMCCIGRGLAALHPVAGVNSLFVLYAIRAFERKIAEQSTGSTFDAITGDRLRKIELPLPPLSEQHRIVAKIEELFTQLDAGIASLRKVQAQFKRYRQAVLKAAFEGRLTQEWREIHHTDDNHLLDYVMQNWEKYHKGKKFTVVDSSTLPQLPDGWMWSNFDQVSQRVTVGYVGPMKEEYIDHGIPFLRSQNVRSNRFDSDGLKQISPEFHQQIKKSTLYPNDIVVVRSGNVGVSCVIPEFLKEANCSDLVIVKQPYGILPALGAYYMNSTALRLVNAKKVGVALTHFNTKSMAEMVVPLPPLEEQKSLLTEIERLFSIADEIEQTISTSLRQAESLRQSILKRAFEGRLVPHNPTDEPASILLERIKAEKALHATEAKKGKTLQSKSPKRKVPNGN